MDGVLNCIPYVLDNRSMRYRSTCTVVPQKSTPKHCLIFSCTCKQRNEKNMHPSRATIIICWYKLTYITRELKSLFYNRYLNSSV